MSFLSLKMQFIAMDWIEVHLMKRALIRKIWVEFIAIMI